MQSVHLQRIMKKNADRGYEKTKPKQTQSNPIFTFLLLADASISYAATSIGSGPPV
jgi:hypothetical protein